MARSSKISRATAEHLGGTRVRFTFPCGHSRIDDFSKGPVAKRVGELGVRVLVRHWQAGGVTYPCPKCFPTRPSAGAGTTTQERDHE
jgi:hypothetical protein